MAVAGDVAGGDNNLDPRLALRLACERARGCYKSDYGNLLFFWDVVFGLAKITRCYPETYGLENLPPTMLGQQLLLPVFPAKKAVNAEMLSLIEHAGKLPASNRHYFLNNQRDLRRLSMRLTLELRFQHDFRI